MRSIVSFLAGVLLITFCFTGIVSSQPVEIIAFGDSITQGLKRDSDHNESGIIWPLHGERSRDGYEPELEADIATQTKYRAYVYNWGSRGEFTYEGVNRIDMALNRHYPFADFILIMEGANDLSAGISSNTIYFNLKSMIDKSQAKNTTPIIATVTPNSSHPNSDIIPNDYNPEIRLLAIEYDIALADQYTALIGNWSGYHSGDGLHLNDIGEMVMAQVWFDAILNIGFPTSNDTPQPPTNLHIREGN